MQEEEELRRLEEEAERARVDALRRKQDKKDRRCDLLHLDWDGATVAHRRRGPARHPCAGIVAPLQPLLPGRRVSGGTHLPRCERCRITAVSVALEWGGWRLRP